jgi:nitrogen PTS system EIIA component
VDLAILARFNDRLKNRFFKQEEDVAVSNYLDERLVAFIDAEERNEALMQLVDLLCQAGKIQDKELFYHAILERERIVSTGIGMGVAIPHAKHEEYHDFFIAIGIQKKKGIEWNALDGSPVRLIFMIGGPEKRQTEYLKILSHLTMAIKDGERRKKLLQALTPGDVIDLFRGY